MPRHPPIALKNLTTKIKDARVHCAVLKLRAVPAGLPTLTGSTPAVRRSNGTDVLPRPLHAHKRVENAGPKVGFHPLPQDPTVCHVVPARPSVCSTTSEDVRTETAGAIRSLNQCSTHELHLRSCV